MTAPRRAGDWILAVCLVGIFLTLALPHLDLPGLHNDEALDGMVASLVLQPADAIGPASRLYHYTTLFGRALPIVSELYVGALQAYVMALVMLLLGMSVAAIRTASVLWSAASLLLLFELCRTWFNRRVALLATLLTATNVLFVQYSRVSYHREELLLLPFALGALLLLAKFELRRRISLHRGAAFLLGVGITVKITFAWFVVAYAAACAAFRRRLGLLGLGWKAWAAAALLMAAGIAPLLQFNLARPLVTPRLILESLHGPTWKGGVDNLRYFKNLRERAVHAAGLLRGDLPTREAWGIPAPSAFEDQWASLWGLGLGCAALLAVLLAALFDRRMDRDRSRRILFLYLFYAVVFLQTPFTVSSLDPGHLMVLFPFPQIVLALFMDSLAERLRKERVLLAGAYALCLLPVLVYHLGMNAYAGTQMRRTGAEGRWSTAVGDLTESLERRGILKPVIFGFALRENLIFLSRHRIQPLLCLGDHEDVVQDIWWRSAMEDGPAYWLSTGASEEALCLDAFRRRAAAERRPVRLLETFWNREGRKVYELYAAAPVRERSVASLSFYLQGMQSEWLRTRASELLFAMAPRSPDAVLALLQLVREEDDSLWPRLEERFVGLGTAAIGPLSRLLDEEGSPRARLRAARILLRVGKVPSVRQAEAHLRRPLAEGGAGGLSAASVLLLTGRTDVVLREFAARWTPASPESEPVPAPGASVPRLVRALYDPSLEARREAILALGALGPAARAAGPALSVMLGAPPHTSELCALWALLRVGGPGFGRALPFLRESLRHRHPMVRMVAAHLAPAAPGAREVLGPDLLRALRDPEHFVRLEAVRALGSIGPGRASGALRRAAGRDPMLGVAVEKALAGPS
ncbi:MAG: hypothetical protein A2X36_15155 [Elusimicrobia bacterium GWA2_69_24]|nr:MAG: hypothetical protein A2X36_15155 [Elusimicrobia bacterium GWA2_69_24]HBL15989.1 hypothetical protein [Elusimicrobiota bacterium]